MTADLQAPAETFPPTIPTFSRKELGMIGQKYQKRFHYDFLQQEDLDAILQIADEALGQDETLSFARPSERDRQLWQGQDIKQKLREIEERIAGGEVINDYGFSLKNVDVSLVFAMGEKAERGQFSEFSLGIHTANEKVINERIATLYQLERLLARELSEVKDQQSLRRLIEKRLTSKAVDPQRESTSPNWQTLFQDYLSFRQAQTIRIALEKYGFPISPYDRKDLDSFTERYQQISKQSQDFESGEADADVKQLLVENA